MRKTYPFFLIFHLLFIYSALHAEIIEVSKFATIKNYADQETLVVLDIDDTLLLPAQTLGNDVWFQHRLKHYLSIGCNKQSALDRALAEWEAVRALTKVVGVEEGNEQVVKELQDQKISVMALTTQGLTLSRCTKNQLLSLGFDLTRTAPSKEDLFFNNQLGVLYYEGILFTAGTPKGAALLKYLDLIGFKPKKVLFINDKRSHLEEVEAALKERNVSFTGLRYAIGDARVAAYRPEIAQIQWEKSLLGRFISDEEAAELLSSPVAKN